LAVKGHNGGEIILLEKRQDLLRIFFPIIFWNVHGYALSTFDFSIVFV